MLAETKPRKSTWFTTTAGSCPDDILGPLRDAPAIAAFNQVRHARPDVLARRDSRLNTSEAPLYTGDQLPEERSWARPPQALGQQPRPGSLPVTAAVLQGVSGVQEPRAIVEAHIEVRLTLASSNECRPPGTLDVDTAHDALG